MLVHGIGGNWRIWSPVLRRLAARRDVVLVDLPGYGGSPRSEVGDASGVGPLADATARFLDGLNIETAHLAGNSMGGWVALELAKRGRARTVTVFSPAGFYNDFGAAYLRASLRASARVARALAPTADRVFDSGLWRTALYAQSMGRSWRLPGDDAAAILRAVAGSANFDADLVAITRDRFEYDRVIPVPVTIAWGWRDRLLLPWQGRRAARMIPGARLVLLPGVGHLPTFDDPDLVADVLLCGSAAASG
ncbi:alpha/beta fold hydrolase [Micromonospora sonneratiae]|uniref:Alpha/beta fold hydrolase n=1 Tax=Micromonospora sonneratiae TaxID=1184706 RepID=A0ABW3Y9G5_9ACTN